MYLSHSSPLLIPTKHILFIHLSFYIQLSHLPLVFQCFHENPSHIFSNSCNQRHGLPTLYFCYLWVMFRLQMISWHWHIKIVKTYFILIHFLTFYKTQAKHIKSIIHIFGHADATCVTILGYIHISPSDWQNIFVTLQTLTTNILCLLCFLLAALLKWQVMHYSTQTNLMIHLSSIHRWGGRVVKATDC